MDHAIGLCQIHTQPISYSCFCPAELIVYLCSVFILMSPFSDSSSIAPSQIDQLILLDRSVDLLTPLATQLTYEGLIDEIFGIHNSKFNCVMSFINFCVNGVLIKNIKVFNIFCH